VIERAYRREELADGRVRLSTTRCTFVYARPRPGVVLCTIGGHDDGAFGTATIDELRGDVSRYAPIELFFEMQGSVTAATEVRTMWTEWLSANRPALRSVSILVQSKFVQVTMEVAKLFSRTGELIRIYLDPAPFSEALARSAPGFTRPV
jgi:hypothetical protein